MSNGELRLQFYILVNVHHVEGAETRGLVKNLKVKSVLIYYSGFWFLLLFFLGGDGEDVKLLPRTPELRRVSNPTGLLRRWF